MERCDMKALLLWSKSKDPFQDTVTDDRVQGIGEKHIKEKLDQ